MSPKDLKFVQIITQSELFFFWNFCQTYTPCRRQSLCNGNILFLQRKVIWVQITTFFQNVFLYCTFSAVQNFENHPSSNNCGAILFLGQLLRGFSSIKNLLWPFKNDFGILLSFFIA